MKEYLYLEHDGKLLLVDNDGNGPKKPIMGRIHDEARELPAAEKHCKCTVQQYAVLLATSPPKKHSFY